MKDKENEALKVCTRMFSCTLFEYLVNPGSVSEMLNRNM